MAILNEKQINLLSIKIIDILASKKVVSTPPIKLRFSRLKKRITIPVPAKLPKEIKYLIKKVLIEASKKGTTANLNIDIGIYEKFSEAVGSDIVGKLNFSGCVFIKAGREIEKIKKQANYIKNLKPKLRDLFPKIIGIKVENGICIYLMELLGTYASLHEMIFKRYSDWQIMNSIDGVIKLVGKIYSDEIDRKNIPQAKELYQDLRIEESISQGREKYKKGEIIIRDDWKIFFPNGIESLLISKIKINDYLLESFNIYNGLLSKKVTSLSPSFITWIHGDLHPGNIMVNHNMPGCEIKLIDPNPDFEKGSDYLYDMGKLLHWFDMMGFVVRERELNEEIVKLDIKKNNDIVNISYIIDERYSDLKGQFFDYAFKKIKALGETFNDTNLLPRVYLSVASAYFGGLKYFIDFKYIIISYVEGMKYLSKAVSLN
ncbi:hypothetical protein ES707_03438 [subsurface metagenome]